MKKLKPPHMMTYHLGPHIGYGASSALWNIIFETVFQMKK